MYYMYATDGTSIAEMPISAETNDEARNIALDWLKTYEHGFTQAVVINAIMHNLWKYDPVPVISERIIGMRPSIQLISEEWGVKG
jgi:hypothetical protein